MNLVLLLPEDQLGDGRYRLADERAEHIRSVLKCQVGDRIDIGLLGGPQGTAEIVAIDIHSVALDNLSLHRSEAPSPAVDLVCALPRPQTLRRVLATCGTMGVRSLHLVRANRVERSYYQSPLLQPDTLKRYLIEGMMQGRQTRMPHVTIHTRFRPFFEDDLPSLVKREEEKPLMILAEGGAGDTIADLWPGRPHWIIAAIGPEGGWVPFELETLQAQGFMPVSLGRWVLRVEAAVVGLLSQVEMQVAGDRSVR